MKRNIRTTVCALCTLLGTTGLLHSQVFTPDPGAVTGYTPQGTGQALYGGFGLNSATDPEYKVYRKFLERDEQAPLSSATNVDGNLGEAQWINVNQRQALPEGLQAPGMFLGQKNHKTAEGWVVSDPNQLLYFKPLIDTDMDADIADSNRNALWDARFGFMESPDDFVDFVEPNSEQLDLWTGAFNTDAVYAQNAIRRDDTFETTNVTSQMGHGGSFKLQSGSPDTQIANESARDSYEMMRTTAGTDEELERNGQLDAGVAYEDAIEVSWGMRLADPDSTGDEFDQRMVEFWVKTGNIIASGMFDPGAEDSFPLDPPNATDSEDYTDGYFDWESAFPVFFAGAQGLAGGEGAMGIFIPGDFGADGAVDVTDFARLATNYGQQATTYSRGDLNQDGITDEADAVAWAGLADDTVKSAAVAAVSADLGGTGFDFDGSGTTDTADVDWVQQILGVEGGGGGGDCVVLQPAGDFDGNGTVEFSDFLKLSSNFNKEVTSYADGDADCNGTVDFPDFLALSGNFGKSAAATSAVPEPTSALLTLLGCLACGCLRRRR